MKVAKRREKKAKDIEEIDKPRGFERGLRLSKILGAANLGKTPATLHFLVQWEGCDELDLLSASEINTNAPEEIIAYYESLSTINKRFEERQKTRLAIALRPVIVSKVEHMMQSETVTNVDLFQAAIQEATLGEQENESETLHAPVQEDAAMVEIPQQEEEVVHTEGVHGHDGGDMPLLQTDEINWQQS